MRKISIMLLGIAAALSSNAQSSFKDKKIFKQHLAPHTQSGREVTKKLLNTQAVSSDQSKTTASYERMIGFSDYGINNLNQFVIFDSASLDYSGMHGSGFEFNFVSIGNYDPIFGAMTPDNKLLFLADHFNIYPNNGSSTLYEYTFTYDNNDNVTEAYIVDNYMNGPDIRMLGTYNGQQVVYAEQLRQNGSAWDTMYRRYFNFDTNNLLIEDSVMEYMNNTWSINQKYEYAHDGNNNITYLKYSGLDDNGIYGPSWEDYYTYDGNNRMETALYYNYDTATDVMVLSAKDSFEYVAGINYFKKDTYSGWDNVDSVWQPIIYFDKHINTQMLPDTLSAYVWNNNAWEPYYFDAYSYTGYGNVLHDSLWGYTNQSVDEDPGYVGHFYYQQYYDLSVKNAVSQHTVNVYPNPATDILNVSCESAKAMKLEIVNALGQTVKVARSSSNAKFSISDLTPGVYWLTVSDAAGNKLHQQTIVKQ